MFGMSVQARARCPTRCDRWKEDRGFRRASYPAVTQTVLPRPNRCRLMKQTLLPHRGCSPLKFQAIRIDGSVLSK